jgi:UDP-N-acetylglucosamine diphosphorylase/glucosamine-1-phosphate N-acetyltransferase
MNVIFFDDSFAAHLLPLSATRPVCDFRIGIYTIREKWMKRLGVNHSSDRTAKHLTAWKFPCVTTSDKDNVWINGRVVPTAALVHEVKQLQDGDALVKGELLIAVNTGKSQTVITIDEKDHLSGDFGIRESHAEAVVLRRVHDIFMHNGWAIRSDMELLNNASQALSATNRVIGNHGVYLEEGAKAECCIFNTTGGPIYIGKNAEVMEGAVLRGPIAIGEGAQVKMSAKIYGDTTIGPGCKVGGEVTNVVFFANSNKGHDGYLGNAVVGEWCNFGADTNCSNLKNNYADVKVYNYAMSGMENTGLQFHGLIFGDHAKTGINTMLNTGTVAGVGANVFGGGFPPAFIPDFSWGGPEELTEYRLDKAIETIERVYQRRNKTLEAGERAMLKAVFDRTAHLRR